jgi:hypothetical protein
MFFFTLVNIFYKKTSSGGKMKYIYRFALVFLMIPITFTQKIEANPGVAALLCTGPQVVYCVVGALALTAATQNVTRQTPYSEVDSSSYKPFNPSRIPKPSKTLDIERDVGDRLPNPPRGKTINDIVASQVNDTYTYTRKYKKLDKQFLMFGIAFYYENYTPSGANGIPLLFETSSEIYPDIGSCRDAEVLFNDRARNNLANMSATFTYCIRIKYSK